MCSVHLSTSLCPFEINAGTQKNNVELIKKYNNSCTIRIMIFIRDANVTVVVVGGGGAFFACHIEIFSLVEDAGLITV